jgi:hypothetical protein
VEDLAGLTSALVESGYPVSHDVPREVMKLWCDWLDVQAAEAAAADPLPLDTEHLVEAIYRRRYGDDALAKRIAYRERLKMPLVALGTWSH